MADSNTTILGLLLQETGGNDNTWGQLLNEQVIQLVEDAIAGRSAISTTGGNTNLTAAQERSAILDVSGTLGSNATLTVENVSKRWTVRNNTAGSFTLSIKTSGGSGVEVPQGGWSEVWCDGSNTIYVFPSTANFTSQMKVADGTEALPGYSFTSDPDSGLRRVGANALAIAVNGADLVDFTTSGIDVTGFVKQRGDYIVPVGTVLDFAGATAPNGFLLCYGQAVSRATYSALFTAIGETYGVGDGVTTFNLPDLRGRVVAGKDDMGGLSANRLTNANDGLDGDTLGATGGGETQTLVTANLPAYTPSGTVGITDSGHTHGYGSANQGAMFQGGGNTSFSLTIDNSRTTASSTTGITASFTGAAQGGTSTAFGVVQPTIIANKIIFTGVYS